MKILYVLIIAIICFILNLVVYYMSEDYRNIIKQLKGVKETNIILKDDYKIDLEKDLETKKKVALLEEEIKNKEFEKTLNEKSNFKLKEKVAYIRAKEEEEEIYKKQNNVDDVIVKSEKKEDKENLFKEIKISQTDNEKIYLSAYDKKVLNLFKKYNLVKLEYHGDLFDVTSEYPDEYFEYYTMDFTFLIFPTKSYKELKDIFTVESNGYNFIINEVDNFGEESFYINLGEDYLDGYIRVVFVQKGRVYGFKVIKSEYENVKNILKKL